MSLEWFPKLRKEHPCVENLTKAEKKQYYIECIDQRFTRHMTDPKQRDVMLNNEHITPLFVKMGAGTDDGIGTKDVVISSIGDRFPSNQWDLEVKFESETLTRETIFRNIKTSMTDYSRWIAKETFQTSREAIMDFIDPLEEYPRTEDLTMFHRYEVIKALKKIGDPPVFSRRPFEDIKFFCISKGLDNYPELRIVDRDVRKKHFDKGEWL